MVVEIDVEIRPEASLLHEARKSPLSDVILVGFVDGSDTRKEFHPMLRIVYCLIGRILFKLSSVEQYSSLAIQQVETIDCNFEIDEDDDFCTCSIIKLLVSAPYADNRILGIEWFYSVDVEPEREVLVAIGFMLEREEYVFVDPLNYFGIQIGGRDRRHMWLAGNSSVIVKISMVEPLV